MREVIGRRLNILSQRRNETLTIASVVGREFELRQLTPLVEDASEKGLLDVLDGALAARVIEELPRRLMAPPFHTGLAMGISISDTVRGEKWLRKSSSRDAWTSKTQP